VSISALRNSAFLLDVLGAFCDIRRCCYSSLPCYVRSSRKRAGRFVFPGATMDISVIPLSFLAAFLLYLLIFTLGTGEAPHGMHILASRSTRPFSYWSAVVTWTAMLGICLGVIAGKIFPA
jgi:hypothetical protein